ncbi:MAG: hypothetical protein WCF55_02080, partial [Pseudolabrys sp.]
LTGMAETLPIEIAPIAAAASKLSVTFFIVKSPFFAETRSPALPRGLPVVATASPVASAAEQQQQEHGDNQEHVHRIPPIRMRRGESHYR